MTRDTWQSANRVLPGLEAEGHAACWGRHCSLQHCISKLGNLLGPLCSLKITILIHSLLLLGILAKTGQCGFFSLWVLYPLLQMSNAQNEGIAGKQGRHISFEEMAQGP